MNPERLAEIEALLADIDGFNNQHEEAMANTLPELIAEVRRLQELALNIGDAEKLLAIEQENRNLTAEVWRLQEERKDLITFEWHEACCEEGARQAAAPLKAKLGALRIAAEWLKGHDIVGSPALSWAGSYILEILESESGESDDEPEWPSPGATRITIWPEFQGQPHRVQVFAAYNETDDYWYVAQGHSQYVSGTGVSQDDALEEFKRCWHAAMALGARITDGETEGDSP